MVSSHCACISALLGIHAQLKVYHWATLQFSHHMAIDGLVKELDGLIDRFVEASISMFGRPDVLTRLPPLECDPAGLVDFLKQCSEALNAHVFMKLCKDKALVSLRDDMVLAFRKAIYLCAMTS